MSVLTKFVNRISVLLSAAHFLAHTFREYGLSFMSELAHPPEPFKNTGTLTVYVNGVGA